MGAVDEEAGAPDRMRGGHNALLDLLCMGLSPIFAGDPSPAPKRVAARHSAGHRECE